MNRTLMLSLALGFALFGVGCSAAVDDRESTDEGAYGLEGSDPAGAGADEGDQTTTGTVIPAFKFGGRPTLL